MKMTVGRLRRIIREAVLFEGQQGDRALTVFESGSENYAVVYDAPAMEKALRTEDEDAAEEACAAAILGMVEFADASAGESWGAVEILKSAVRDKGQGMGAFLYAVVMNAAKNHTIMSDRRSVSDAALGMWKSLDKKAKSGALKKLKFDDEGAQLTDPTKDDAMLNPKLRGGKDSDEPVADDDVLNHAYRGTPDVDVKGLAKRHEDVMDEAMFDVDDPEGKISKAAVLFFRQNYGG